MAYLVSEWLPELRTTAHSLKRWAKGDYSSLRSIVGFPQWNLGFIPIPRNASGSLLHFFGHRAGLLSKEISETELRRHRFPSLSQCGSNPMVFAFVRNPWARLYSVYTSRFLKRAERTRISEDIDLDLPPWVARKFYFEMPFDQFVHQVCRIPDAFSPGPLLSQHRLLVNESGTLLPQFVGRVERIEADVARLCRILEIEPGSPSRCFASHPDPVYGPGAEDYREVYTPRLYAKVGRRYARDVTLFGYRPLGMQSLNLH